MGIDLWVINPAVLLIDSDRNKAKALAFICEAETIDPQGLGQVGRGIPCEYPLVAP